MSGLFITATGTEIGKTFVTAALCHQARQAGRDIMALKPVISGVDEDMADSDTATIAEALGLPANQKTWDTLSPFRFRAPMAPTMAAAREGRSLSYEAVIGFCRIALQSNPFTLIEGVGGSFVPLANNKLVADWIRDLKLQNILVAGSYLGTLSHTIATVEAMIARGLQTRAIIVCESLPGTLYSNPPLEETAAELANLCGLPTIAVPRQSGNKPWQKAPALLDLLSV